MSDRGTAAAYAGEPIHAGMPPLDMDGRALSRFEFWPTWIVYLPVALQWLWLSLRYGGVTLPTLANPLMEAGGLCGESKTEVLCHLGPEGRRWLAPFASVVTAPPGAPAATDLAAALDAAARARLAFPLVAKPDISCQGTGVRVVDGPDALAAYLAAFPRGARVILQQLVPESGEAGIFYVRRPDETKGRIISLTLKYFPHVVGDGRSTVEELIRRDRRAGRIPDLYLKRLAAERRRRVLAAGEPFRLAFVGNHCKGAIFRDGRAYITEAMTDRIDRIAREVPEFYFGRFDVRFRTIEDLRRGEGFRIIEYNGAGSEATHIWDRDTRLLDAWRTLLGHGRLAFEIGARNRVRGFRPTAPMTLLRLWRNEKRLMRLYPVGQ
ncbi:MAG TPA: D-alanine--D-alanine ligase [Stellaceae bacterium]|jgi:hypothetical protein